MLNIEKELGKSEEDIFANFEKKRNIIIRDIKKERSIKLIVQYLLTLSSVYENRNMHYSIAVDIVQLYLESYKRRLSFVKINNEEYLLNILFRSCVLAKRYGTAKKILEVAKELDIIVDTKGYEKQLDNTKFNFSINGPTIIRIIYVTLFFVSLSFIEQKESNVFILVSSIVVIELMIVLFYRKY